MSFPFGRIHGPKPKPNTPPMQATIKDNKLTIVIDLQEPKLSKTGKTYIVASSGGNITTTAKVDGKPVIIGLNAFIKP